MLIWCFSLGDFDSSIESAERSRNPSVRTPDTHGRLPKREKRSETALEEKRVQWSGYRTSQDI